MSGGSLPPAFLAPRSVAVVGASRDPSKVGGSVLANLRAASFPGRVVPINPRAGSIQGLRALPSVLALEEPVDLAVIAVPAADVLPALEACVARGVAGAIIISAGFREAGLEGQAREAKLRSWLRGQPIRVMGPNCLGWIRPSSRLNATFAPGMPTRGGIGFVSHSGALATAILDWARDRSLGFSFFASLGNQADLTEADVLVMDEPLAHVDPQGCTAALDAHAVADRCQVAELGAGRLLLASAYGPQHSLGSDPPVLATGQALAVGLAVNAGAGVEPGQP